MISLRPMGDNDDNDDDDFLKDFPLSILYVRLV